MSAEAVPAPLETKLQDLLKQSMRDKDPKTSSVVRMLKTKIMEKRTSKGFSGAIDDTVVTEVIAAYRKAMQKGLEEFEKAGVTSGEQVEQMRFEIAFCEQFLPKGMDPAALEALVKERVAALGITDQKQIGKLLGDLMKSHKGQFEANDVKKIAERALPKA